MPRRYMPGGDRGAQEVTRCYRWASQGGEPEGVHCGIQYAQGLQGCGVHCVIAEFNMHRRARVKFSRVA